MTVELSKQTSEQKNKDPRVQRMAQTAVGDVLLRSRIGMWSALFSKTVQRLRKQAIAPHLAFEDQNDIDRYAYADLSNIEQFYAPYAETLPEKKVWKLAESSFTNDMLEIAELKNDEPL